MATNKKSTSKKEIAEKKNNPCWKGFKKVDS